jgi:hypothetical protein
MKPEYHEGPEALERFGKMVTALFRAQKTVATKKAEPVAKRTVAERGGGVVALRATSRSFGYAALRSG